MSLMGAALFSFLPSRLKVAWLRARGVDVGPGVHLGFGMIIVGRIRRIGDHARLGPLSVIVGDEIEIGRYVRLHPLTLCRAGKVTFKDFSKIGSLTIISGREPFFPRSELALGVNSYICPLCWIDCGQKVLIGDDVSIGGSTQIFTHGSFLPYLEGFPFQTGDVVVGNRVYIPWRVFIMPGTTIGDDVIIGAKALLRGDFPSNCMAVGIPARIIKQPFKTEISDDERRRRLLEVLERLRAVAAEVGEQIETVEFGDDRVHLRFPSSRGGAIDVIWRRDEQESPSSGGKVVRILLDDTLPVQGSFFNARLRRYRFERETGRVGMMVRRIFSYYGVRGMPM